MGITRVGAPAAGLVLAVALVGGVGCSRRPTGAVEGHVTQGPMCPVERPDVPCPDAPVKGAEVTAAARGFVVRGHTDDAGAYHLDLPAPDSYTLTVGTASRLPTCPAVTFTVTPNATVTKDVSCDSGIR
jgi:hypothetical protein